MKIQIWHLLVIFSIYCDRNWEHFESPDTKLRFISLKVDKSKNCTYIYVHKELIYKYLYILFLDWSLSKLFFSWTSSLRNFLFPFRVPRRAKVAKMKIPHPMTSLPKAAAGFWCRAAVLLFGNLCFTWVYHRNIKINRRDVETLLQGKCVCI